jgi:hypothetical protein
VKTTIAWTLMFRVSSREKAEKELERAGEILGQKLRLAKCERYWKIPELWTCNASSEFDAPSEAEQVFRCLMFADRLARGWSVSGPDLRPNGALEEFDGFFDHRHGHAKIQSLEWAEFSVIAG